MKKRGIRFLSLLMSLTLLLSIAAAPVASAAGDQQEIVIMLWGDEPNDMGAVLAEYEARTKDTLNTKINIIWTPIGDYANKLKLKLSAGEPVDACFDAQWLELINFINQGNYVNLDPYFESGDYPGLSKAFSKFFLDNNRVNGHVYAIPLSQTYSEIDGVYIRKDLREKYGLDPIDSLEALEHYFDLVLENEQGVIPFASGSDESAVERIVRQDTGVTRVKNNVFQIPLGAGMYGLAILSDDLRHVEQVTYVDGYAGEVVPLSFDYYTREREWYVKGYLEREVISQRDPDGLFKVGRAAARGGDTANFYATQLEVRAAIPGGDIEFFVGSPDVRAKEPEAMTPSYGAWNFIGIPTASTKADTVMKFFDWLFGDQANHDLFELGVEGVHWTADGADRYSIPENAPAYRFNGYEMTWNANYMRYPSDIDANVLSYLNYMKDSGSYYNSGIKNGFTMNTEPVKTELAKVAPVISEAIAPINVGMVADPIASLKEAYAKAERLGAQKIFDEAQRQLEEFLQADD